MSNDVFTQKDVIDSHNRSSNQINDWARLLTTISIVSLSAFIPLTIEQDFNGITFVLYFLVLIPIGIGVLFTVVFLYKKATLGFKKATIIRENIGRKIFQIEVSVGRLPLCCAKIGFVLMAIGFVSLIAFACARQLTCSAKGTFGLTKQLDEISVSADRARSALRSLQSTIKNFNESIK